MPIVEYTPKLFGDVSEMVSQVPGPMNLAHRPFVDYYYATGKWSKLYLYYSENSRFESVPIGTPCSGEWGANFPNTPHKQILAAPG